MDPVKENLIVLEKKADELQKQSKYGEPSDRTFWRLLEPHS